MFTRKVEVPSFIVIVCCPTVVVGTCMVVLKNPVPSRVAVPKLMVLSQNKDAVPRLGLNH